jgi:hypothetical protein
MFYANVENNTAGSKATLDCSVILNRMGFENHDVPVYLKKGILLNIGSLLTRMLGLFYHLHASSTVVIQYPLLGIHKYLKIIIRLLRMKRSKVICIIHDIDSLRSKNCKFLLSHEILRLNNFDVVICHNRSMERMLLENGLTTQTCIGVVFDYLLDGHSVEQINNRPLHAPTRKVAFAGNLGKSFFLKDLHLLPDIFFSLYGPGYSTANAQENARWCGSFNAEELPLQLDADFGLIWDGDSIEDCVGYLGNYLKYNNPHKASLYMVSQLPLIAPRKSAIGNFIEEQAIGITVDSLFELKTAFDRVTEADYFSMKNNLRSISAQIASGTYLKQALATATVAAQSTPQGNYQGIPRSAF